MILAQARYYEHYQLYIFDLVFRNVAHGRNAPMANNDSYQTFLSKPFSILEK